MEDCKVAVNQHNATECDTPLSYDEVFDTVEDRVTAVWTRIRAIAPQASIMLLGYPYLTPVMEPCDGLTRDEVEAFNAAYERLGTLPQSRLSGPCVVRLARYLESFIQCASLEADEVAYAAGSNWFEDLLSDAAAQLAPGVVKIDPGEAWFLRRGADDLNAALQRTASAAGVHFVNALGGVASARHPSGFVGHDQCSGVRWLNGFVADDEEDNGVNGKSFHPTVAGHVGYAEIVWDFVRNTIRNPETGLTEAGLPGNPIRRTMRRYVAETPTGDGPVGRGRVGV
ncbi:hypothetical protein [Candidatus Poriferisodalis sp.]|uniref:hypothetical protein n=1 Tax=Candidatus Poriferisodalis sp. TaxID=3101277 RepID=UPI003B010853